jgi:PqqD family protein of HPr-rel-A system
VRDLHSPSGEHRESGNSAEIGHVEPVLTAVDGHPEVRTDLSMYPLDDDLVVYDPQSGQSYILNATGRTVWSLCDGERSEHAIAEALSQTYGVAEDQMLKDVLEVLVELRKSNLLRRRQEATCRACLESV